MPKGRRHGAAKTATGGTLDAERHSGRHLGEEHTGQAVGQSVADDQWKR
jgi:hypothetical protein